MRLCAFLAAFAVPRATATATADMPVPRINASMSSTYDFIYQGVHVVFAASNCIDNDPNSYCHSDFGSDVYETNPWISIYFGGVFSINSVVIENRRTSCEGCQERLGEYEVYVGDTEGSTDGILCGGSAQASWATWGPFITQCGGAAGSYVTIRLPGSNRIINLGEILVYSRVQSCPRPSAWCGQSHDVYDETMDCDGDGIPDPHCIGLNSEEGIVSSANNCQADWPNFQGTCPANSTSGWLPTFFQAPSTRVDSDTLQLSGSRYQYDLASVRSLHEAVAASFRVGGSGHQRNLGLAIGPFSNARNHFTLIVETDNTILLGDASTGWNVNAGYGNATNGDVLSLRYTGAEIQFKRNANVLHNISFQLAPSDDLLYAYASTDGVMHDLSYAKSAASTTSSTTAAPATTTTPFSFANASTVSPTSAASTTSSTTPFSFANASTVSPTSAAPTTSPCSGARSSTASSSVSIGITLNPISYGNFIARPGLEESLRAALRATIAIQVDVPQDGVDVCFREAVRRLDARRLVAGDLEVAATISASSASAASSIRNVLESSSFLSAVEMTTRAVPEIASTLPAGLGVDAITATVLVDSGGDGGGGLVDATNPHSAVSSEAGFSTWGVWLFSIGGGGVAACVGVSVYYLCVRRTKLKQDVPGDMNDQGNQTGIRVRMKIDRKQEGWILEVDDQGNPYVKLDNEPPDWYDKDVFEVIERDEHLAAFDPDALEMIRLDMGSDKAFREGAGEPQCWDQANPTRVHNLRDKEAQSSDGCVIHDVEERAISVRQLQRVKKYVYEACMAEGWKEDYRSRDSKLADPNMVNLYTLLFYLILPATKKNACSFVEFIAAKAQRPRWFVSHWWGESIKDFVACLHQHCQDRRLGFDSFYWVCAYANNQRSAGEDVGASPLRSSFMRGMRLADGVVHVIDPAAICFSRVWCDFEVWVALQYIKRFRGKTGFFYDMYTALKEKRTGLATGRHTEKQYANQEAVGITDGLAEIDSMHKIPADAKYEREYVFPIELGQRALALQLEKAQASVEVDRRRILNCILGKTTDLDDKPPSKDPKFSSLNHVLRGRFAVSLYRAALESQQEKQGVDMRAYRDELRQSELREVVISFDNCNSLTDGELEEFAKSLPATAQYIKLDFTQCTNISGEGAGLLMDALSGKYALPELCHVDLDFRQCDDTVDFVLDEKMEALVSKVRTVKIHGAQSQISEGASRLSRSLTPGGRHPSLLSKLTGDFSDVPNPACEERLRTETQECEGPESFGM